MVLVYIQTQGCSANQDDTSIMADLIRKHGYDITHSADEIEISDVLIINTCTVKNPTEDKFVVQLSRYKEAGKKVIVAGCIAQSLKPLIEKNPKLISIRGLEKDEKKLHSIFEQVSLVGVNQVDNIVDAIENELEDNHVQFLENKDLVKLADRDRANKVETVQILTGCLGAPCTYCKTIFARGKLKSFPLDEIKRKVSDLVSRGTKIIWLTSQDNAVWGMDINSSLPVLLNELLSIEGDFKIRLGMGNPDHYVLYIKELAEIFKHPKMFKFFHIPIQSGSNKVLTRMRRGYTMEQFDSIYALLSKEVPDLVWATDIICGFPYETDEDFEKTMNAVSKYKFDVVNISQFYPRLGTLAADMPQVPTHIKKQRSKQLSLLHPEIAKENKNQYVNTIQNVIVEAKKGTDIIARTDNYTQVILKGIDANIGQSLKTEIVDSSTYHLLGELYENN